MAYEIPGFVLGTLLAGDDLHTNQYCFVDGTAGDAIGLATAAAQPLGVLNNAPEEGDVCEIVTSGVAKVKAGGAIAEFAKVEVGSNGKAVTIASGFAAGVALEEATGDGQIISVRLGDYGK